MAGQGGKAPFPLTSLLSPAEQAHHRHLTLIGAGKASGDRKHTCGPEPPFIPEKCHLQMEKRTKYEKTGSFKFNRCTVASWEVGSQPTESKQPEPQVGA
jgi:hypothetical protein